MIGQPHPFCIGIDIGADTIHIATSIDARHPVISLQLDDPDWSEKLIALIPRGATVALEPTGWHYSAPIIAVCHHVGAHVLQVEHRITGKVRDQRAEKEQAERDREDARAWWSDRLSR